MRAILAGLFLGCLLLVGGAGALNQVMVAETSINPPVLMPGDTGIITLKVMNTGDGGVNINRAYFLGGSLSVTSDPYPTVGWLGGGNTMDFTFTVRAGSEDGLYYPRFILEFSDGNTLRYTVPVQVDRTDLVLTLQENPDFVGIGTTTRYTLTVSNPRPNAVTGVQVFPEGTGFEATPSSQFIGYLGPDSKTSVMFNITPDRIGSASFQVMYRNGINDHHAVLNVPLVPTDNQKGAEPVISNIQVTQDSGVYRISGDISNAGLKSAKSVVIRTDAPAIARDPYKVYVVGSLDPDDFSSFEVSFDLADSGSVPLIVEYKDEDGNRYLRESHVEVAITPLADGGGSIPQVGFVLVLVLVIVIAGVILYSWRKR